MIEFFIGGNATDTIGDKVTYTNEQVVTVIKEVLEGVATAVGFAFMVGDITEEVRNKFLSRIDYEKNEAFKGLQGAEEHYAKRH